MTDMLVKLYQLPAWVEPRGGPVEVRKPLGAEARLVVDWVGGHFGAAWGSEAATALGNRPVGLWIAVAGPELLGFACYDATARGMFGPIGVAPQAQSRGIGARLLRACLEDMRAVGYGYAVIGGAGPAGFFARVAGAIEIAGSDPGIYRGMLRSPLSPDRQPGPPLAPPAAAPGRKRSNRRV